MKKILTLLLVSFMIFGASALNIYAADFEVTEAVSNHVGNIFFDNEDKSIVVKYKNNTGSQVRVDLRYEIVDAEEKNTNTVYSSSTSSVVLNSNGGTNTDVVSISGVTAYGTYRLKVTMTKGTTTVTEYIPFSLSVDASKNGGNPNIGIASHLSWNENRNSAAAIDVIKKAGFTHIRESYLWQELEATAGTYSEPQKYQTFFTAVDDAGIKTCTIMAWNNTNYNAETKKLPQNPTERAAFANYVYEVLDERSDSIDVIQIWNEPDHNNQEDGDIKLYVELLKAVWDKVRSDSRFDDIKIAAPAMANGRSSTKPGGYGNTWLTEFFETDIDGDGKGDAAKYFDVLSIHHYFTDFAGLTTDDTYNNASLSYIKPLLAKYNCADKEIYTTEFGSHQAFSNSTDELQASRIIRYYMSMYAQDLSDRMYLYTLSDEPSATEETEGTFGILEPHNDKFPYAAKPAFLAMSSVNNLLNEDYSDENTEFTRANGVCVASFTNSLKTKVTKALFLDVPSNEETDNAITYELADDERAEVKFFDLYGNLITFTNNAGVYEIPVTHKAVYAVYDYGEMISVYPDGEEIVIKGQLADTAANTITIKVLKSSNNGIAYLNEDSLAADKSFSFAIRGLNKTEKYTVLIGNKFFKKVYTMQLDPMTITKATVAATNEVKAEISDLAGFKLADKVIVKTKLLDPNLSDFKVVAAYYNSGALAEVQLLDKTNMHQKADTYEADLAKTGENVAFDEVKIFMLDSMNKLTPLGNCVILN